MSTVVDLMEQLQTAQRLLTLPEAAVLLRIARASLYRLFKTGRLETVRIGSRRFVSVAALDAFIARESSSR